MFTDINTYARIGLEAELARLDGERERVRRLLASLDETTSKPLSAPPAERRRGQMSEAGRQAIRDAQKRRWARVRAEGADGDGGAGGTGQSLTKAGTQSKRGNRKK